MSFESSLQNSSLDEISSDLYTSSTKDISDIFELQNQILSKSKKIENFIENNLNNSNKSKHSQSFPVLESLYSLFKAEVSMNLSLRKSLINEMQKNSHLENQISQFETMKKSVETFISEIAFASRLPINSLNDVYDLIISSKKIKKELSLDINELNASLNNISNENSSLLQKISKKESRIQKLIEEKQQLYIQNEDTIKKLQQSTNETLSLKAELEKIRTELRQSNITINQQHESIRDLQMQHEEDIKMLKKAKKEKMKEEKNLNIQMQTRLQGADNNSLRLESSNNVLREKLNEAVENLNQYKRNFAELNIRHENLQEKVDELSQRNLDLESQLKFSQNQIQKLNNQIKDQQIEEEARMNIITQQKCKAINLMKRKQHHKLNKMSNQIGAIYEDTIQELSNQISDKNRQIKRMKYQIEQSNNSYKNTLNAIEIMKKATNEKNKTEQSLRMENERLRNSMRKQRLYHSQD